MAYEAQREFFSKYPFTRELDRTIAAEMNLNPNTIYQYRMGNNRLNYRRAVELVSIMRELGIHVHTLDAKALFDYARDGKPLDEILNQWPNTVSTGAAPEVVQTIQTPSTNVTLSAPGYAVTLKPSSLRVVLATIEAAELTQAERLELIRHLAAA